tara:strand:+ start:205 stop:399 length:195 start_codon:yes stop_codon:yes gene_type:complete
MAKESKDWLSYSGLGIQMVLTVLIFLWIGKKIEIYFIISEPIGQLCGLMFGIFASMYNLIKSIN